MKKQTPAGILALHVQTSTKWEYFHVNAYPVRLDTVREGSVRNVSDSGYGDEGAVYNGVYLPGLTIYSQGNNEQERRPRSLYGYEAFYEADRLTRRNVHHIAKAITLIDKRLDKLNETRGYVKTYGEYVGRMGEVIGATVILMRAPDSERYSSLDDGTWQRWTLGDGVGAIDRLVQAWVKQGEAADVAVAV